MPEESDEESDSDDEDDYDGEWVVEETEDEPVLHENYRGVIDKVIKIVQMFRRSPKKYEELQDLIVADLKREYALVKNCPTRWNGLLALITRFLKVHVSIEHALVDLKKKSMMPSDEDVEVLKDMRMSLKVLDTVSRKLQDRSVTLAEADRTFEFALKRLNTLAETSNFGLKMRDAFLSRILYRRHKGLTTLMSYLENHKFLKESDQFLPKATKEEITSVAEDLFIRVFQGQDGDEEPIIVQGSIDYNWQSTFN